MRYRHSSTALNPKLPVRNSEKFGSDALKLCAPWAPKKLQLIWKYQIFRWWVSISMSSNCRELRVMTPEVIQLCLQRHTGLAMELENT